MSHQPQQNQKALQSFKIVDRLYKQKFSNTATSGLAERRRIVKTELKPKDNEYQLFSNATSPRKPLVPLKNKSRSVGSLLPKIAELQTIAKNQNVGKGKQKSHCLSNLQIYLSQKNIKKEQQLNILFLTQSVNSFLSDKAMNQKFADFIAISRHNAPKNLRALLNLSQGMDFTQQAKQRKFESQKQQLTIIAKNMIVQRQVNSGMKTRQELENPQDQSQQQQQHLQKIIQNKNINWIIQQCQKFHEKKKPKFKVRKIQIEHKNNTTPVLTI